MLKTKKQKINHKRRTRKILKGGENSKTRQKIIDRIAKMGTPMVGEISNGHRRRRGLPEQTKEKSISNSSANSGSSSGSSSSSSLRSESRNPTPNTESPKNKNNNNTNLQNNDINILSKIKNKYGMQHLIDYLNYLNILGNLKAETKRLETKGEDHYKKSEEYLNLSEYYFDLLTIIQLIKQYGKDKVINFLS
jgi:hypothetical protein